MTISRRAAVLCLSGLGAVSTVRAARKIRVTGYELIPVRATGRTVWLIVRLRSDAGLSGLGEASDAFGFSNTTKQDAMKLESELRGFFGLIQGKSPLDVEAYRAAGERRAREGGLMAATAYSAIEQALWDLSAQSLEVPAYAMFGGKVRTSLPVYANINRATRERTPAGFAASASVALKEGFRAFKAAPFDGFPKPGSDPSAIQAAVELGIACTAAIRQAIGPKAQLMIDCHSFFSVEMAKSVARRLEPENLSWYEEPVAPVKLDETVEIRRAVRQPLAGGEILFGVRGFAPLCHRQAVHVIMPDVKHCGGLLEMSRIAAMADADGVEVAPHNPSGPVATAASVQACAGMKNFRILELQWGEVPWRGDVVQPAEGFENGTIAVPDRPGFGISLNDRLCQEHRL